MRLPFQHCVAVVHVPGRRLFSQNLVHVYKDGYLVKTAPLRCPSLSEVCQAGFGGAVGSWGTSTGWGLEALSARLPGSALASRDYAYAADGVTVRKRVQAEPQALL